MDAKKKRAKKKLGTDTRRWKKRCVAGQGPRNVDSDSSAEEEEEKEEEDEEDEGDEEKAETKGGKWRCRQR